MSAFQRTAASTKINFELQRRKEYPKSHKTFNLPKVRFATLTLSIVGLVFGAVIFNSHIISADDLPVIQKFGTLQNNETWTAGNVYMITGTVTVPDSITLTIEDGAIVKHGGKIQVNSGGTLNVDGTSNDPVIFTSYRDDSAGGDSNGDGTSSGDYGDYGTAISALGGEVGVEHSVFRYGNSAANIEGDSVANFANVVVANSTYGIKVDDSAQFAYRGSFDNIAERAIESCNWGEDCAVDAAYVDWGSADGPLPSGKDPMACGQVAVSPWVYSSNTYNGDMFTSENCDGSPLPTASLSSNASYFNQEVAEKQIDCSNGFQDACDAIDAAFACLGGALSVAQSQIPWPLPPATTQQEVQAFASGTVGAASTYLTSEATQSVTGFSFGLLGKVAGAVSTISTMASAYGSCAP